MPWVQPLPLGGLATELGNTTERLRSLEVLRSGWAVVTTDLITLTSSTYPAWDTPTGWPTIDIVCTNPLGLMVIFGGLADIPSGGTTNRVYLGFTIDGTQSSTIAGATFGFDSFPYPEGNINALGIFPMGIGGHTISLTLSSAGTGPYSCYNQFLAVGPIP